MHTCTPNPYVGPSSRNLLGDLRHRKGCVFGSVGKTLVLYAPVWYLLVLHNLLTTLTRVFKADSVL